MVPEHELASTPAKFFWFDLATMRQHLLQQQNRILNDGNTSNNKAASQNANAKLV
jgi:hypothetical protein